MRHGKNSIIVYEWISIRFGTHMKVGRSEWLSMKRLTDGNSSLTELTISLFKSSCQVKKNVFRIILRVFRCTVKFFNLSIFLSILHFFPTLQHTLLLRHKNNCITIIRKVKLASFAREKILIYVFPVHLVSMFVSIINDDEKETVFIIYLFTVSLQQWPRILISTCTSWHYSFVFVFFFGKPFSGINIFFKFCHK